MKEITRLKDEVKVITEALKRANETHESQRCAHQAQADADHRMLAFTQRKLRDEQEKFSVLEGEHSFE